jgi:hypothetical protein
MFVDIGPQGEMIFSETQPTHGPQGEESFEPADEDSAGEEKED